MPYEDVDCDQRQAMFEKLGLTLERDAEWAGEEGDSGLELLMRSMGTAILTNVEDLAASEISLIESIVTRAIGLITAFHSRYPNYPVGPQLH
jgi:hypothetical protein